MKRRSFDHEILLFQGGGALGAYQAGVYEGLAEAGMTPNWFVGISIGAVNSRDSGRKSARAARGTSAGILGPRFGLRATDAARRCSTHSGRFSIA